MTLLVSWTGVFVHLSIYMYKLTNIAYIKVGNELDLIKLTNYTKLPNLNFANTFLCIDCNTSTSKTLVQNELCQIL